MEKKTGKKKKKNAKERNSPFRVIGATVLILCVILAAAFVASDVFGRNNVNKGKNETNDLFYSVISDNVVAIEPFDKDGLTVLTDTAVKYFDVYGNPVGSNEYTYADPVIRSCGKNLLLFDRGAYSMRLEKNGVSFSDMSFNSVITTAAIGKKGNYAYVLNADEGYQSHLYVNNYRGVKQFEWGCSSDYIVDVALSDNGKYACAAVIGADNAEYFSRVILFRFNADEPVYSVSIPGTAVYNVRFIGSKKIVAYTDRGVYRFEPDGSYSAIQTYTPNEMNYSSAADGAMGSTVINQFGDEKNVLLTFFAKNYKETYTKEYKQIVKMIRSTSDYVAVVLEDHIEILNSENSLVGNIAIDDICLGCAVSGRNVYVLNPDGIRSYGVTTGDTSSQ